MVFKKIFLCCLIIAFFFLFLPASVHAAAYYVSTTGSDSNPGTLAQPWRTIQKAANTINAGDTAYIRGGTYTGIVNISKSGTSGSTINIFGFPGETAIVDGGGNMGEYSALFTINGNYVHVQDLEIIRGGMGLVLKGSYGIATRIHSHNHISNGILVNGTGQGNVVEDSTVHDTCEYNKNGTGGHWGSALSAARSPKNTIIRRNLVYDNWGEGLSAYGGASGTSANGSVFEDNIAYDNWSVNLYI